MTPSVATAHDRAHRVLGTSCPTPGTCPGLGFLTAAEVSLLAAQDEQYAREQAILTLRLRLVAWLLPHLNEVAYTPGPSWVSYVFATDPDGTNMQEVSRELRKLDQGVLDRHTTGVKHQTGSSGVLDLARLRTP